MNDNPKCPPCHGDCRQGRDCNAEPSIARLMLEVNRLSIELEQSNKKLAWFKKHAPITYELMLTNVSQ
jgi:hypothetical protein